MGLQSAQSGTLKAAACKGARGAATIIANLSQRQHRLPLTQRDGRQQQACLPA